ncbi:MAG TPA: pyruvate kinase [Candidatus Binatia bacterium]|jgi:pyruvate kinase|nr:pyruvate kinase [Candidatus Binatia bacterium]
MARTRIVATLGPASDSEERIAALLDAGVDVVRCNLSHGTHAEHARRIALVRRLAGARPVAVLVDLGGPKLRTDRRIVGKPGDVVELPLPSTVRAGDPVLLADGMMQLEVVSAERSRILVGGDIAVGKGINLPSSRLDMPSLTPKDRVDLRFAVEQGADVVALSFVRCASDLDEARASGLPVIAKIERAEAVEHLDEIVHAADGVLVARGDLGVEIPIERVPLTQKRIIALANREAKPVITATQMLRSMVDSPLPTRAEATDVANAVLDGTDCVMLSEESAMGAYPVQAVAVMRRIVAEAETALGDRTIEPAAVTAELIAHAAVDVACRIDAAAIVVATRSGFTAQQVARHRPRVPIIAVTATENVRRRLSLVWGVTALTAAWLHDTDAMLERFREPVLATGLVAPGSRVVITAGWPFGAPGITNLVHVAVV